MFTRYTFLNNVLAVCLTFSALKYQFLFTTHITAHDFTFTFNIFLLSIDKNLWPINFFCNMQINYIFSCVRALKQSKARKTFFSAQIQCRKKNGFNVCVLNNLYGYKTAIASLLRCACHQKVCAFRLRVCCSLILWRVEVMGGMGSKWNDGVLCILYLWAISVFIGCFSRRVLYRVLVVTTTRPPPYLLPRHNRMTM